MNEWMDIFRSPDLINAVKPEPASPYGNLVSNDENGLGVVFDLDGMDQPMRWSGEGYELYKKFKNAMCCTLCTGLGYDDHSDVMKYMSIAYASRIGGMYDNMITPGRDDGMPALVTASLLTRNWDDEKRLHNTKDRPALSATWLGAKWYNNWEVFRPCGGPTSVLVKNYTEYYHHGEFRGFRHDGIFVGWPERMKKYVGYIEGTTYPLGTRFFGDIQDEAAFSSFNHL